MLHILKKWLDRGDDTRHMIAFRQKVLQAVADTLCDPGDRQIQQALKLWNYSDAAPQPARDSLHLHSANGTLSFRIAAGEHDILFSIYFMFGRLYTGAYVPQALLQQHPDLVTRLSHCMDGRPASAVREDAQGVLFDWWFRDGPMAAEVMLTAMKTPMGRSAITDFVVLMCVQMYWSMMHILVESQALTVPFAGLTDAEHLIDLHTRGRSMDSLRRLMQIRGIDVLSHTQQAEDRYLLLVRSDSDNTEDLEAVIAELGLSGTVLSRAA